MLPTRTRPIILIVEDYADSRRMLKLLLEDVGYGVFTAATGKDALAIAATNRLDLLLTDFDLPDTTGPNVVRQVRRLSNQPANIPAVMLTAFDGYEYRKLAHEAGCDAFLTKPPDFEVLRATVERLLRDDKATTARSTNTAKNEMIEFF